MPIIEIVEDRAALNIPCVVTTVEEARPVIQNLMDTAHYHKKNCAGLAANQVGSSLRVFIVKVHGKFKAFINPSFFAGPRLIDSPETCLSFPGRQASMVRRAIIVTSPPVGKRKGIVLHGIPAVAFQHELDHLNGITIMDEV